MIAYYPGMNLRKIDYNKEARINVKPISLDEVAASIQASPLSNSLDSLHEEAYQAVRGHFPDLEQSKVYVKNMIDKGDYLPEFILLRKDIASLDQENISYLVFKEVNSDKGSRPEDFFKVVLIHEYGHKVFDRYFKNEVSKLGKDRQIENESNFVRAINEAFAFWISSQLTGFTELTEDLAITYSSRVDVQLMKHMYLKLQENAVQKGVDYVSKNFGQIVESNLDNVCEVKLPNSSTILEPTLLAPTGEGFSDQQDTQYNFIVISRDPISSRFSLLRHQQIYK